MTQAAGLLNQTNTDRTGVRIGISNAEDDDFLVLMVAHGDQCHFHHLSLAAARAVSLELIKNVYQAELRKTMNLSMSPKQFQFRSMQQRLRHPI